MRVDILETECEIFTLTDENAASSYGIPVLVIRDKHKKTSEVYGPGDLVLVRETKDGRALMHTAAQMLQPMLEWEDLGEERERALRAFMEPYQAVRPSKAANSEKGYQEPF